MKNLIYFLLAFIISSGFYEVIAQSDFEKTEKFKDEVRAYESSINEAVTLEEINQIRRQIETFRKNSEKDKGLLDKALYPDNYSSVFSSLEKKLKYSSDKIAEISTLSTDLDSAKSEIVLLRSTIEELSGRISELSIKNNALMQEIKRLKGDPAKRDTVKKLVTQLRDNLKMRDDFIAEVVDSLFLGPLKNSENLNDVEKAGIATTVKNINLIYNIKRLISDHTEYINRNLFSTDEIVSLKKEQQNFRRKWSEYGSKLVNIYSESSEAPADLTQINNMIYNWEQKLDGKIWGEIHEVFNGFNFDLEPFTSDTEFLSSVMNFLNNEITLAGAGKSVESQKRFGFFSEDVWKNQMEKKWLPFLIQNKMFTEAQQTQIENKIEEWEQISGGMNPMWIYIIIISIMILIAVFVVVKVISGKNKKEQEKESDNNTPDILV